MVIILVLANHIVGSLVYAHVMSIQYTCLVSFGHSLDLYVVNDVLYDVMHEQSVYVTGYCVYTVHVIGYCVSVLSVLHQRLGHKYVYTETRRVLAIGL